MLGSFTKYSIKKMLRRRISRRQLREAFIKGYRAGKRRFQRIDRLSLREVYIRGYKAARRRLNEATNKGIWQVVLDDLETQYRAYRKEFEHLIDNLLDGAIMSGATGPQFYREVNDWYDSLTGEDGHYGMEDDLLSQVEGAVNEWIKKHQREILKSFDKDTLQDLSASLFRTYVGEIGMITGDREILQQVDMEDLLDDDDY